MKLILALCTFIFFSTSYAQVKHIVFDLDGTLVQGIPTSKVQEVKLNQVIQGNDGRSYAYVIRPHAREILQRLLGLSKVIVHISSSLSEARTTKILTDLKLFDLSAKDAITNSLGSIQLFGDKPLNPAKITSDKDSIIYITSRTEGTVSPESLRLFLGHHHYYFDSFEAAQAEKNRLKAAGHFDRHRLYFADSEEEYSAKQNNLAFFYYAFISSMSDENFASETAKKYESSAYRKKALLLADNKFLPESYTLENSVCRRINILSQSSKNASLDECIKYLKLPLEWNEKSCAYMNGKETVLSLQPNECVRKLPVKYAWNGKLKKSCAAFAQEEIKAVVGHDLCASIHAIPDGTSYRFFEYFEGMEKLADEEILSFNSSFSLDSLNAPSKKIGNVIFPRTGEYLWRAMGSEQYDLPEAIRAMLGDRNAHVESRMFTYLRFHLMGKASPVHVSVPREISTELLKVRSGIPYAQDKASEIAKDLIKKEFNSKTPAQNLRRLIDYSSNEYDDFHPQLVFSSLFPSVCHLYNKPILISFREKHKRSIDLTYWNFAKNGYWRGGKGMGGPMDLGEYVTPGQIEASDITGIFTTAYNTIQSAYLKIRHNNEIYIAAVAAPNRPCLVVKEDDQSIRSCINDSAVHDTQGPVTPGSDIFYPDFLIKLCSPGRKCSIPEELAQKYRLTGEKSQVQIHEIMQKLKHVKINGKAPSIFTSSERAEALEAAE